MSTDSGLSNEPSTALWARLAETLQALEDCGEDPMLVDFGARYEIVGRSGRASWSGRWSTGPGFDASRFHVFLRPEPGCSYGKVELQVACSGCMTVVRTVDEGIDLAALLSGAERHCQRPGEDGGQG